MGSLGERSVPLSLNTIQHNAADGSETKVQLKPKQFSGLIIRAFIHQAKSDRATIGAGAAQPEGPPPLKRPSPSTRLGGCARRRGTKAEIHWERVLCVRRGQAPAGRIAAPPGHSYSDRSRNANYSDSERRLFRRNGASRADRSRGATRVMKTRRCSLGFNTLLELLL